MNRNPIHQVMYQPRLEVGELAHSNSQTVFLNHYLTKATILNLTQLSTIQWKVVLEL